MPAAFNPDTSFYRRPSVTAFNRLVPVPVKINYEQNLRAEVHDPLWFAARQWQMGEFIGEDAGAPAFATIESSSLEPSLVRIDPTPAVAPSRYNYRLMPLEVLVEREAILITIHMRVQAGFYLQKILKAANLEPFLPAFINKYPLPENKLPEWDIEGIQLLENARGTIADGVTAISDFETNGMLEKWIRTIPTMAPSLEVLLAAVGELRKWMLRTYPSRTTKPSAAKPKSWKPEQLEHSFSFEMSGSETARINRLRNDTYADGQLDWPDFTWEGDTALTGSKKTIETYIPTPVRYQGMPRARYWEMEEGSVNFGNISISPSNILSIAFAEFGLAYSNDWFWMPVSLKMNTLCRIDKLELTNVFGEKTTYSPSVETTNDPLSKFTLFRLMADKGTTAPFLYLPPTLTKVQEAAPLEQVYFLRDEQSNLAWAVETIVPSASQRGTMMKATTPAPEDPVESTMLVYKLGNVVPENWTPFIPVRMNVDGSDQTRLQRARMPEGSPAKGHVLQDKPFGTPYFLREEEITRAGTLVERLWQRVRWINGKTFTWIGRRKTTGRIENSSGLSWDQVKRE